MRIAQIILPPVSAYERKSQRVDRALLSERHELVDDARKADVVHVYGSSAFLGTAPRWPWQRVPRPRVVVTPENLPEVVEDAYFRAQGAEREAQEKIVGSFRRKSTQNHVEQTLHRMQRFRDDVTWRVFDAPPSPEDLLRVDVWADPAVDEADYDGFVAEALVVGLSVVAARTAVNVKRLEQGRTGLLVPMRDPNEMTHAILAALFKSEVANSKISAARQTVSKFRGKHRLRTLIGMYETLIA